MEQLSKITETIRAPVNIPVYPHMMDHHLEGRIVLPAVEAMEVLASSIKDIDANLDVSVMTQAAFHKFLYIRKNENDIPAFNDITWFENGEVRATLITKKTRGSMAVTRALEHAKIYFSQKKDPIPSLPGNPISKSERPDFEIPKEKIYPELIAFGSNYHNLKHIVEITDKSVTAIIRAPDQMEKEQKGRLLGSPFPMDAAFHAACVWGQRYKGVVPFPTGIAKRVILRATRPGNEYVCRIRPVAQKEKILMFDIWLLDAQGMLCESISGLEMRDVSNGRIKPLEWIKKQ